MRRAAVWVRLALFTAVTVAPAVVAADAEIIGTANVATVAALLPHSIRRWVERGDFTLKLGELTYRPRWDEHFMAASAANRDRYTLDDGLQIVTPSGERPAQVFGFPFPEIDPAMSDAGARIMWNRWFAVHKRTQIRFPLRINLIGRGGVVRTVESRLETLAYYGREGDPLPNPEGTEWREIVRFVAPTFIEGTTSLTWRFFDARWDNVWMYLPVARRVRQVTSTNRSDALAGSDVVLDDGLVWAGKNQSFTWKLVGSQEMLVAAATLAPQPLHPGARWENGTEWVTGKDYTGVTWGYEQPGWKGAPWAPATHYWVKRPVWIVEGQSRDPYYNYGRQLFYVDRETYHAYAKIVHTRAGEYWKTVMVDLGMACAPDGERCYPVVSLSLVVDDLHDRATATTVAAPDNVVRINTPLIRPEDFSVQGLLKKGK
jgi:hypothetical protein